MVRQFKYHEQKLLKKVDFLNVSPIPTFSLSFHITALRPFSGNKMLTCGKSK
jgi:hypothetical protein